MQFSLDSFIRGGCIYGDMNTKSLHLKCEDGNEHDKYAVFVMTGGRTDKSRKTSVKSSSYFLLIQTGSSNMKSLESV